MEDFVQYPHVLNGTITGNAIQDEATGDWTEGQSSYFNLKCRARSIDTSGIVKSKDGIHIDYSWIVYMPKTVPEIQIGTEVTVTNEGNIFLTDTVKRFFQGQLNSKVWL